MNKLGASAHITAPLIAGITSMGCVAGQHLESLTVGVSPVGAGYMTVQFSKVEKNGALRATPEAETTDVLAALRKKVSHELAFEVQIDAPLIVCEEDTTSPQEALEEAKRQSREAWAAELCPQKMGTDGTGGMALKPDADCKILGPVFHVQYAVRNEGNHEAVACVGSTARRSGKSKSQYLLECGEIPDQTSILAAHTQQICADSLYVASAACETEFSKSPQTIDDARANCQRAVDIAFGWDKQNACLSHHANIQRRIQGWLHRRR